MAYIKNIKSLSNIICSFTTCILIFLLLIFIIIFLIGIPHNKYTLFIRALPIFNLTQEKLTNYRKNMTSIVNYNSFENSICDKTHINRFPISSTTPLNDTFDIYRKTSLEKYCNIVPIPRNNWLKSHTYKEDEIVFVIFTAALFYHTRATATRDTWLSRITNYYFLSATPYPYLPVTVIPGAGEDKLSNMKKVFYGLHLIYQEQQKLSINQRQKWFYIIGCDTFILPHHLLKRIDGLDYTKPYLVGGHWGRHTCFGRNGKKFNGEFPSGGAGFFFSMKLLELMDPHLINYVENIWPRTSEISDVALACLAADLGVGLTKEVGFWAHPPAFTLAENGRTRFHKESEPNDFHYIKPDEMYALDEFYVNQHIDRLINDQNWNEFIQFTRRFISSHYELLRKKRRECILPKIQDEIKLNKT